MDSGARLMYASGVDLGIPGFRLDYYFCFDEERPSRHLLLRTMVDRRRPVIPSVTRITTQADWCEREMIEFLGIEVKGPSGSAASLAAAQLGRYAHRGCP